MVLGIDNILIRCAPTTAGREAIALRYLTLLAKMIDVGRTSAFKVGKIFAQETPQLLNLRYNRKPGNK